MPTSKSSNAILLALQGFADELTANFSTGIPAQPEDQLKPPTHGLLQAAGKAMDVTVQSRTEVQVVGLGGRPDIGVAVNKVLTGYIELKAPGKGADTRKYKGADKSQWEKFKDLPNLLYTDGNEWALYRSGSRIGELCKLPGNVTTDARKAVNTSSAAQLTTLLKDFFSWSPIVPSSPKALAALLAPLCRLLKTDVLSALQDPTSDLSTLANDWRVALFADATDEQFADAYAQTLTYALLLARLSGAADLSIPNATKSIRPGHRLLADALKVLGDDNARELIRVPVDLLERVIGAVDIIHLAKKSQGDPWLYFYEDFLAEYDPELRKARGVYFTPVPVVQAQVHLVSELLIKKLGAPYGFVDKKVITLDPATGTGTYILTAMQHGLALVAGKQGKGMRKGAATIAANNLHAFELLVGPYAVAHLRLTQQVLAEGGSLPNDGAHVYLTDTLESPYVVPPGQLPLSLKRLGEEHQRAQQIKLHTPVFVCIGNPPYDRENAPEIGSGERRKGGWIRYGDPEHPGEPLLRDFLEPLTKAGLGVHAKNLYNDYVYFWRWALWKVFESTKSPGIVSFITASSYIRGPGFIGMREYMRKTFDELYIIDLGGDNLGARPSDNVFAIQTPVAIAVGVSYKAVDPNTPAAVYYSRIDGTQEEKLAQLNNIKSFQDLAWSNCPTGWQAAFLPTGNLEYQTWPLLTHLFPWQESGLQFKRSWPIGETKKLLEARWKKLLSAPDRAKAFKETRDRKINKSYKPLNGDSKLPPILKLPKGSPYPPVERLAFRSFDRQWALMDSRLGDFLRPALHRAHSSKQVYLTSYLTEVIGTGPAAVATALLPDLHHFRGSFGGRHVIPLWRDADATVPNITSGLLDKLEKLIGQKIESIDLMAYVYAMLFSTRYTEEFWEELATPGPRVPITRNLKLFNKAVRLGKRLVWLHTFGERLVPPGYSPGEMPQGQAICSVGTSSEPTEYPESFSYDAGKKELRIGTGVFSKVRPDVWNFSISGLQVVHSWLSYRRQNRFGRQSSSLDELRPERWEFDQELLDLLWALDATVDMFPELDATFQEVRKSKLVLASALPTPSPEEREAPEAEEEEKNLVLPGF